MFARLLPFIFNSRDALVLVFTDSAVSFVKNGAPILAAGAPYAISTPYRAADLAALAYVQSGDVVTLVHPSYPPYELKRLADANWTLTAIAFGATIAAPALFVVAALAGAIDPDLTGWAFVATTVGADGEESLASPELAVPGTGYAHHPIAVSWTAIAGARSYRVYRRPPQQAGQPVGAYGFVGVSSVPQFTDDGADPDFAQQPPIPELPFASADNYPSAVGYWQQRLIFANTNTNPNTAWASQVGRFHNFNISVPVKDDDAITFRLLSDTVDEIRHLLSLSVLAVFTDGAEWAIPGDRDGTFAPSTINPQKTSSHGVGIVRPVAASGGLLFPQALGSTVLGLSETAAAQYTGTTARDLTLFSAHLFDGHQIVDMAWQQETPHVAWCVRDDGVLLGLTYIPAEEVLAWHRHDMDGIVESACTIPELVGRRIEHRVYLVVGRTFGSTVQHTIERFASPFSAAIDEEAWFVDGGVEYDGRYTGTPASTLAGLDHLEGRAVAIYAFGKVVGGVADDIGHVVANPLRSDLAVVTVTGGAVALGASYLRVVVGLPFVADVETLDLERPTGPTAKIGNMLVNRVGLELLASRNLWAGLALPAGASPTAGLLPLALATDADADQLVTDFVSVNTQGEWTSNGRVALRSIDPTPFTLLAAVPQGFLPEGV